MQLKYGVAQWLHDDWLHGYMTIGYIRFGNTLCQQCGHSPCTWLKYCFYRRQGGGWRRQL